MTISLKHTFSSAKADGADSTVVQPSDWNDEHVLTLAASKVLGRKTGSSGAAQELSIAVDSTDQSMIPPAGNTAARPAGVEGMFRHNSQTKKLETYLNGAWSNVTNLVVAGSAPSNPVSGDLWYNSVTDVLYTYNGTSFIANQTDQAALWVAIASLTGKTTPVDADKIVVSDSAASNAGKSVTLTNLWANYLKAKADALYQPLDADLTAVAAVGVSAFAGHLWGLTLSNNGSDAVNDIDIAAGVAIDATNAKFMTGAAITKQLDANWAVGTNQGGLDTGAVANGTYHVWLIMRSDTGVVDALFSLSATAPTMPTNYDYKRRIGSILRESATIIPFTQRGDEFERNTAWTTSITDPSGTATSLAVGVPTGIVVNAHLGLGLFDDTTGTSECVVLVSALTQADVLPTDTINSVTVGSYSGAGDTVVATNDISVFTNTSAQVRYRSADSSSDTFFRVRAYGWTDTRGRLA